MAFIFHFIDRMSSFPLTNSDIFQRGVETTNQIHIPYDKRIQWEALSHVSWSDVFRKPLPGSPCQWPPESRIPGLSTQQSKLQYVTVGLEDQCSSGHGLSISFHVVFSGVWTPDDHPLPEVSPGTLCPTGGSNQRIQAGSRLCQSLRSWGYEWIYPLVI